MALVTSYSTLKTHIADTLNRTSLTGVIPNFIQQFEARSKRGITMSDGVVIPVRNLVDRGTYQVSADGTNLPSDIYSIESLYHDGPTYYGPIEIVSPDQIGWLKGQHGDSDVPQFAAIVNGEIRWAPEPDGTYTLALTYWRVVRDLSDDAPANWLLNLHSDIYLYGALVESAPYLKDDPRLILWDKLLIERVIALEDANMQKLYGGGSMRRHFTPIGG